MTQAKDLDDTEMLRTVETSCVERACWSNTWEIADRFPAVPFKVVHAKLRRLLNRGLLTGCPCGCRGDWEVTSKGREFAGITSKFRDNPVEP